MKLQNIFLAAIIFLSIITCKKESPDTSSPEAVFEAFKILDNTRTKFYEFVEANGGDPWKGIALTGQWLETQPGVKKVIYEDSVDIFITMESGKKTVFGFNETTADGTSKFRGGGKGNQLVKLMGNGNCSQEIANKKVLIFGGAYSEFYLGSNGRYMDEAIDIIENEAGFTCTVLKDEQCTPEIVETFGNYGLVLIETHGTPESFQSGVYIGATREELDAVTNPEQLRALMDAKLGPQYFQWLLEDKIEICSKENGNPSDPDWWVTNSNLPQSSYRIFITSRYITSLPPMPGTVILGNMCYSGYGITGGCNNPSSGEYPYPIKSAFMSLDPITYYGYAFTIGSSARVSTDVASVNVRNLIKALVQDSDSTGDAHLNNGVLVSDPWVPQRLIDRCGPLYFFQFGKPGYCYGGCGDSITDARDGKKYATVCIGDQVWMAQNLNYAGPGNCYAENAGNCNTYGRMYTYKQAIGSLDLWSDENPSGIQGICPNGWHVPSVDEWEELFDEIGGRSIAAKKLKSTTGWTSGAGTDDYGFKLLPGGQGNNGEVNPPPNANNATVYGFTNLGTAARVWTTYKTNDELMYVYFSSSDGATFGGRTWSGELCYCRCVKD